MLQSQSTKLLEVKNLAIGYASSPLYSNLDFTVNRGQKIAIIGPSGSGKSTLLKTIAGQIDALKGEVYINGKVLETDLSLTKQHPSISYLNQTFYLLNNQLVSANFKKALKAFSTRVSDYLLKEVVEAFVLKDLLDKYPTELSIGQRQRVALALAFANPVDLLVLDEPFSHQDSLNRPWIIEACLKLSTIRKSALILVSHNLFDCLQLTSKLIYLKPSKQHTWSETWLNAQRSNDPYLASLFHTVASHKTDSKIYYYKVSKVSFLRMPDLKVFKAVRRSIRLNDSSFLNHYQSDNGITFTTTETIEVLKGQKRSYYLEPLDQ